MLAMTARRCAWGTPPTLTGRTAGSSPRQASESLREMGLDPGRHELRRKLEAYRPARRVESTQGDRPQPGVEGAGAAVATKAAANLLPRLSDRIGRVGLDG